MSRIEELIKEKCPSGVSYKRIESLVTYKRGKGLSKEDKGTGNNPIVLYGELYTTYRHYIDTIVSYASDEAVLSSVLVDNGDVILPISSTTKEVQIGKASVLRCNNVSLGGDAVAFTPQSEITAEYLMYMMNSGLFEKNKMKCVKGVTIRHLDAIKMMQIEIPVPPIEIQQEIVRILDKFTELEAELQAELDARKKQYEYYRENLVRNSADKEVCLSEIVDIYLGLTATPNYTDSGVKFISAQNTSSDYLDLENVKYISEEEYKQATSNAKPKRGDLLFTRVGSNLGHPVIVDTDEDLCIFVSLGYLRIKDKSKIRVEYLKHWMNSELFWRQLRMKAYGAAKVNLNTGWLKDFLIPVPSIEKQDDIIESLEVFDVICNDNNKGLSTEIEARHKQYEYYRDKLLTFERKVV